MFLEKRLLLFIQHKVRRAVFAGLLGSVFVFSSASMSQAAPSAPKLTCTWAKDVKALWQHVYNAKTDAKLPQHPAGNGADDDLPALNADIQWIHAHGGGVLYLPAGTYRVNNRTFDSSTTTTLEMPARVAVEGDGQKKTILSYGAGGQRDAVGVGWHDSNLNGFYNLTLRSAAPPDAPPYDIHQATVASRVYYAPPERIFLNKISWEIGSGDKIYMQNAHHFDVEDCTINGQEANYGVIWWTGCTDFRLIHNNFHYKSGRIACFDGQDVVMKRNTFIRDGGIHAPRVESGGIDVSFGSDVIVQDNYVTTLGELDYGNNDGECLLTQVGGDSRFYDVGTLTQASGAELTDSSKAWTQNWKPHPR